MKNKFLHTIRSRIDFLDVRIAEAKAKGINPQFDKAEKKALQTALTELEAQGSLVQGIVEMVQALGCNCNSETRRGKHLRTCPLSIGKLIADTSSVVQLLKERS